MNKDYKMDLVIALDQAVAAIIEDAKPIQREYTGHGVFCDYDMPTAITPEIFSRIGNAMKTHAFSCFYELSGFSGVYKDGIASEKMLQRITVTAFEKEEGFLSYKQAVETAAEHDHKKINTQLRLFSTAEDIGAGLVLWHPKGAMLRYQIERFGQSAHILNGYEWVYSPHIGKAKLWETSGHLGFYRDSMYAPLRIDEEDYYLKPMNCPFHIGIYNSETRSYRDLPIRYAEYGTVYRYELSGALSGLTRVRGFTQDDAHIICTPEQVEQEVSRALKFSLYILRSFGLTNFEAYVSTKPKTKFIGSDDDWAMAIDVLKKAVISEGLPYKIDEGGGAFYGPKIDIKLYDVLKREWQCSTIQFDFNLPSRFSMGYVGPDGKTHTPFMVHRALFGSIERFTALLIEHFKGEFPLWLAPVQLAVIPIKTAHNSYCKRLEVELKKKGFRVVCDYADINMREKIKRYELQKIPLLLIVGDRELEQDGFTVRNRKQGNIGFMTVNQLSEFMKNDLAQGEPQYISDD